MTTSLETGAHVTPERIRAGGAAMERAGFRLAYECPLEELEEDYPRARWLRWTYMSLDGFSESIPGEDGRMA